MVDIKEKEDCCGCRACVQACPKSCIDFSEDEEGFCYPQVNLNHCINCGLCEKVCPVLNPSTPKSPLTLYAAKNNDEEIRRQSSSGGIFTLLAEYIINKQGVVFGATFDKHWDLIHSYTETLDGLKAFRGSKYVQSDIGDTFKEAWQFLKQDRYVLFTGTPCQIAGLHKFLAKEYPKLYTMDIICHGVPSRKVWRNYLQELFDTPEHKDKLTYARSCESISFRDKKQGWRKFGISIQGQLTKTEKKPLIAQSYGFQQLNAEGEFYFYESLKENTYLVGFLRDLFLRPSCTACPAKSLKSGSDITIADFWGIKKILPQFADNKGTSLVILNSNKAQDLYQGLDVDHVETDAHALQPTFYESTQHHPQRTAFFKELNEQGARLIPTIKKFTKAKLSKRIRMSIKMHLSRLWTGTICRKNKFK